MSVEALSYRDLQDEVLSFQFSEVKYRPLVKRWLNQGVRRAVIESEIRTDQTAATYVTEAGDSGLELPTNYGRLISLRDTDEHDPLNPVDLVEFDRLPTSSGRPTVYTLEGNELGLYPTPDGVYNLSLRYWRLPNDMVADTDTPELPAQYHELPIAYAMRKAYLRENDIQQAQVWDEVWSASLLKMRGEVQRDSFDGPRQLGGTWSDPHAGPTQPWR